MNNYLKSLNPEIKEYFKILCDEFPEWLYEYINTDEMKRLSGISLSCGMDYSDLCNINYWYSNLEHSIGVALIVWNFTHDKKQTLAGLFHDIAAPTFKHCIDFMNGDALTQESTEERTSHIIKSSKKITELLERDNIKVEEVEDYHIYPIADNDTPMLSADRFEYTFSSGLTFNRVFNLEKIKEFYQNITVTLNELEQPELTFKDKTVCEEYIKIISKLWPSWVGKEDKLVMQFLADTCKAMNHQGHLTIDELYELSEKEVLEKIYDCPNSYLSEKFIEFQSQKEVYSSHHLLEDVYCRKITAKKRYINPLVLVKGKPIRIKDISKEANQAIEEFLNIDQEEYISFEMEFNENLFYGIKNKVLNLNKY